MVAGALVMMGSSTAAAAGIAGGLVFVFGGTGAGLAGYKMNTRTAGLTDFQFKQYEEKVTYCWYVWQLDWSLIAKKLVENRRTV